VSRGLATGDIDNDGDLDLLVTNNGRDAELLRNTSTLLSTGAATSLGAGSNHALLVALRGGQKNTAGIGATIRVTAGGRTQRRDIKAGSSYLSQNDLRAHFGLGAATAIDRVDVEWPSGRSESVRGVLVDQIVTIEEGKGVVAQVPLRR
jgi:enediyne biosynthesis protein E4